MFVRCTPQCKLPLLCDTELRPGDPQVLSPTHCAMQSIGKTPFTTRLAVDRLPSGTRPQLPVNFPLTWILGFYN